MKTHTIDTTIQDWAKRLLEDRSCMMVYYTCPGNSTGWPGLMGYSNHGLMILVGVIPKGGVLDSEIRNRLLHLEQAGGLAYVAAHNTSLKENNLYTVSEFLLGTRFNQL